MNHANINIILDSHHDFYFLILFLLKVIVTTNIASLTFTVNLYKCRCSRLYLLNPWCIFP